VDWDHKRKEEGPAPSGALAPPRDARNYSTSDGFWQNERGAGTNRRGGKAAFDNPLELA